MRCFFLCLAACCACQSVCADSLFTQESEEAGTLVAERVARFEVGDIITVLVREEVQASTTADTNTKKESDVESDSNEQDNPFLVADEGLNIIKPEELPNWKIEAENETKNAGTTRRTSTLTTTITCFIVEILRNGNLVIEGEKRININREESRLSLRGIVRPKDVTPANTVPSPLVAAADLKLSGKGPLWNNQRRGLVTRFLDWFSPF